MSVSTQGLTRELSGFAGAVLLFLLLACQVVSAQEQLTVVVGRNEGVYQQIVNLVRDKLQQTDNRFAITTVTAGDYSPLQEQTLPVITIGTQAAKAVYANPPETSVISALITQSAFNALRPQLNGHTRLATLFLDQPYGRFLALGKTLAPEARSVGILLGPTASRDRQTIADIARAHGLSPVFALITPEKNPINVIEPVIQQTDFFVVIPDQQAINQSAAKWVIQLGYRHKKPIIAYSRKYAMAGALASVYVSPEDIATDLVKQILNHSARSSSQQFSVYVNPSVARSLRISLPDNKALEAAIANDQETL